jgi:hypothetical protein
VKSITNQDLLPTTITSVLGDNIEFKKGSILCFVDNRQVLKKTQPRVQEMLSSSLLNKIAFCNSESTYNELKTYCNFDFDMGFCTKLIEGHVLVSYIYNRNILPAISQDKVANFEVGCFITHYNDQCIIGWLQSELDILFDQEGITSLEYVTTEAEYAAVSMEPNNKRKAGIQQELRLQRQSEQRNARNFAARNITPDRRDAINADRRNITPDQRDAQNDARRVTAATPEHRNTRNAVLNLLNADTRAAADLEINEWNAAHPDEEPRRVIRRHHALANIARSSTIDDFNSRMSVLCANIGPLGNGTVNCCEYCGARYWIGELNSSRQFNRCCNQNRIRLPPMNPPTALMTELFVGVSADAKAFLKKARTFNSALAFASVKCVKDKRFTATFGVPNFRISGSIYHQIGAYTPPPEHAPAFLQCYFYDGDLSNDHFKFTVREKNILTRIQSEIKQINPFIRSFESNILTLPNITSL